MAYNKVVFGDEDIIDLTEDTIDKNKVHSGLTFHEKSGDMSKGLYEPVYTTTLTTDNWVEEEEGSEYSYKQTLDISFIESSSVPDIMAEQTQTKAIQKEFKKVLYGETADGTLYLYCNELPSVNIVIEIRGI